MPATLRICKGEIQAITPDLKFAVTKDRSSTLRFWDLEKDSPVYDFEFEDYIRLVELSPDGKRVMASNSKDVIRIWDLTTGQRTHTLRGNAEEVQFAWSPDGKFIAVSGQENKIHVMDLENKRIHKEFRIPTQCAALSWSPDGKLLAVSAEVCIYFLDANTGKPKLNAYKIFHPQKIQWNPSGKPEVLIRGMMQYFLLNLRNFEATAINPGFLCTEFKYTPDGRFLLIGNEEEARIYDPREQKVVQSFRGHTGRVLRIACSEDMREIVATADNPADSLTRWESEKPKPVKTLLGFRYDTRQTYAYTSDMKYYACTELKKVCVRETATWKLVSSFSIRTSDYIHSLAFSPDGKLLALSENTTVQVWDWEAKTRLAKSKEPSEGTFDLVFSPDGKYIAGRATEMDAETVIWKVEGDVCQKARTFNVYARHIYWTRNGKSLLAVWDSANVLRIDVEKERIFPLTDEEDKKHGFYYNCGKYALIFGSCSASLINISLNKRETFIETDTENVAISTDSKWLAHSENGKDIKIYDLKTKAILQVFEVPSNDDSLLDFSPNGKFLALSVEKSVYIWSTKTWEIAKKLELPKNITSVEWSDDSQHLAIVYGGVLTIEAIDCSKIKNRDLK